MKHKAVHRYSTNNSEKQIGYQDPPYATGGHLYNVSVMHFLVVSESRGD